MWSKGSAGKYPGMNNLCVCVCVLQLSASEPIELSRIYPTPPSVENNEGEKFDEVKMSRITGGADQLVSGLLWENVSLVVSLCQ